MREYGQVQSAFWQSTDAQAFSDGGKLLALYLLTGPHANGIGCYWLPNGYITADLGWVANDVDGAFAELSGNGLGNGSCNGFAYRFEGVVFIPKFLKWNKIANPNVASARFAEFDALSNTESKRRVARAMLEFCHHWNAVQKQVLETVAQTVTPTVCQTEPNPTQPYPTKRESVASANRGTRLPADWKPSDAEIEWAKQERPSIDVQLEAAKFADYWHGVAGAKGVKLDWSGTWRNWIRRADSPKNHVAPMTGTPRKRRELGT